jgi:hypothetical protein
MAIILVYKERSLLSNNFTPMGYAKTAGAHFSLHGLRLWVLDNTLAEKEIFALGVKCAPLRLIV